jgi:DNA-nicking Smr family endonuclease
MAARGPRRRLRPDERRLWERVASGARPLRPDVPEAGIAVLHEATTGPDAPPDTLPDTLRQSGIDGGPRGGAPAPVRSGTEPSRAFAPAFADALPVGRREAGLDRRTAERLRKGARAPDARIDLHGMTADRAHRACLRLLADSLSRGHRVVLVITGKGRRDDRGGAGDARGVLRSSLPAWLRASPFGHSIVGIFQAHRRHGGEGAFYVYLKRHR